MDHSEPTRTWWTQSSPTKIPDKIGGCQDAFFDGICMVICFYFCYIRDWWHFSKLTSRPFSIDADVLFNVDVFFSLGCVFPHFCKLLPTVRRRHPRCIFSVVGDTQMWDGNQGAGAVSNCDEGKMEWMKSIHWYRIYIISICKCWPWTFQWLPNGSVTGCQCTIP